MPKGGANRLSLPDSDICRMFVDEHKTCAEIGASLGVHATTIHRRIKEAGIKISSHQKIINRRAVRITSRKMLLRDDGYLMRWIPPSSQFAAMISLKDNRGNGGYVMEHRLVMAEHLGRCLLPTEVVHHKDDDRAHNDFDNPRLHASHSDHMKEHMHPEEAKRRGSLPKKALIAAKEPR